MWTNGAIAENSPCVSECVCQRCDGSVGGCDHTSRTQVTAMCGAMLLIAVALLVLLPGGHLLVADALVLVQLIPLGAMVVGVDFLLGLADIFMVALLATVGVLAARQLVPLGAVPLVLRVSRVVGDAFVIILLIPLRALEVHLALMLLLRVLDALVLLAVVSLVVALGALGHHLLVVAVGLLLVRPALLALAVLGAGSVALWAVDFVGHLLLVVLVGVAAALGHVVALLAVRVEIGIGGLLALVVVLLVNLGAVHALLSGMLLVSVAGQFDVLALATAAEEDAEETRDHTTPPPVVAALRLGALGALLLGVGGGLLVADGVLAIPLEGPALGTRVVTVMVIGIGHCRCQGEESEDDGDAHHDAGGGE
mmetsp:Transcript_24914/g.61640  ORF Transcript_24914/g.61640 Transcript_24914/m.61640 type:complete len:367 (-) Transcript_24914:80-1180(-)